MLYKCCDGYYDADYYAECDLAAGTYYNSYAGAYALSPKAQAEMLKEQAEFLGQQLEDIRKAIAELEKEPED